MIKDQYTDLDSSLEFNKILFWIHLAIFIFIVFAIYTLTGFALSGLVFLSVLMILYLIVLTFRSKSFFITKSYLTIHYALLNKKILINLKDIKEIAIHKKIAERDWYTLKIKNNNGKSKTYGFLFVKSSDFDSFSKYLESYTKIINVKFRSY